MDLMTLEVFSNQNDRMAPRPPGFAEQRGAAHPHSQPHTSPHTDPPRVPVLSSLLEAPGGRGAVLRCHVDSRPPALLRLHKDGVLLASSPPDPWATAERLSVTAATNSLRVGISDVQLEDEGEYECSASNAYGNASTTANLTAGSERG